MPLDSKSFPSSSLSSTPVSTSSSFNNKNKTANNSNNKKSHQRSLDDSEETTPLLSNSNTINTNNSPARQNTNSKTRTNSNNNKSSKMDAFPSYNYPTSINSSYGSNTEEGVELSSEDDYRYRSTSHLLHQLPQQPETTRPRSFPSPSSPQHLLSPDLQSASASPGSPGFSQISGSVPISSQPFVLSQAPVGFSYHRNGPQRTSYTTQKLKLLPDQPGFDEDEESGREVYSQVTRIKDTPARKDAERLGKAHRSVLPRVTAYCTASSYRMKDVARYLGGRRQYKASPKLFDECLYTPYTYKRERDCIAGNGGSSSSSSSSSGGSNSSSPTSQTATSSSTINNSGSSSNKGTSQTYDQGDKNHEAGLMRLDDEGGEIDVELTGHSDVFLFEYGVAVFWGFTEAEERRFLKELARFENEKLSDEDVQVEEFNYYITKSYQPRIYNDFITLRDGSNYMIKLSISHAIAQSVKISLFEELVDNTIDDTQDFPQEVAVTGKISMSRKDIMKSIGELFILRINVNLHGSVLDSPELMWAEPHLEPIYQATRGYLEITQRVQLLNQRLEVIGDLLQMLKEQMGYAHEEYLEFIVIVLIAVEIIVAIINVVVDYFASKG